MANIHNEELDDSKPEFTEDDGGLASVSEVRNAMSTLRKAMWEDPGYAWSWHCNIAMAVQDEGVSHAVANKAAARFMESCFNVKNPFPPLSPVEAHNYTDPEKVL